MGNGNGATKELRVAIADDEPFVLEFMKQALTGLGHEVVGGAQTGTELVELCREKHPDLIVTDIRMPEKDGISALTEINDDNPTPAIVVSAFAEDAEIARAARSHALAFLVKPINVKQLPPAIGIAMCRFTELLELRREADDLRQTLIDRKIIEHAKGIIMKHTGLDEPDAYRRIQKLARNRGARLVEIARSIVAAGQVFST